MKTVNNIIDLIEIFLEDEEDKTVTEIARSSGLNISTANRIASTLVKRGYLKQAGRRGKYALGTRFLDFSNAINNRIKIRDISMPFLGKLAFSLNECAVLTVLNGFDSTVACSVSSDHILNITPKEISGVALHSTCTGKAILSHFSDLEFEDFCKNVRLIAETDNTITNIDELRKHLLIIKEQGVATEEEEHVVGVRGVGAQSKTQKEK